MKRRALDVEALAGNWSLAASLEGFELVGRRALPGGFGNEPFFENRDLMNRSDDFDMTTSPQEQWSPVECSFLFGTPPCAGFSPMNMSQGDRARGVNSTAHDDTWQLIKYAARCFDESGSPGPTFVAFEGVQQHFTQGLSLMRDYRRYLTEKTGSAYDLTHVLVSGATLGAACERRRYFWVAHKVPFGVDVRDFIGREPVTLRTAIQDLEGLNNQWEDQVCTRESTIWASIKNNSQHAVTDHASYGIEGQDRADDIIEIMRETGWKPGLRLRDAAFQLLHKGTLPDPARRRFFDEQDCWRNFAGPRVVFADRPMDVITGGSVQDFLHYNEYRFLSVREMCRVMGLPDDWMVPTRSLSKAVAWIGKNAPVENLRWISHWVRESLDGNPGPLRSNENGLINVTYAWKHDGRSRIVGRWV